MKNKTKNKITLVFALAIFAFAFLFTLVKTDREAYAIAPGCTSSRPTAITGTVNAFGGTYNNWSVNVLVGMDLLNSSNKKVDIYGNPTNKGYSYVDKVNPTLAPPGAASGDDRTIGADAADGNGVLCVSTKVKTIWFEVYPKDVAGNTDKTYYGEANDENMPVKAGATNTYGLRLPTSHAYYGNTGDINGYASYQGHGLSASNLQFRVFPVNVGTACGVQGFSAGANTVGGGSATRNYYRVFNLAGGQCNQASQKYKIFASCLNQCGVSKKTILKYVYVANGKRPRIDFSF